MLLYMSARASNNTVASIFFIIIIPYSDRKVSIARYKPGIMPSLNLDPIYTSFHNDDPNMMPSCLVDGRPDTFILTTGGFPQDIIFTVGTTSLGNVSSLQLCLHDAKDIVVEGSASALPTTFEKLAARTLSRSNGDSKQVEQLNLDAEKAGKSIRYLRLRLLSGYSQFVGLFNVEVIGEDSPQRIALMESRPEVVL